MITTAIRPAETVEVTDPISADNAHEIVKWIREGKGEAAIFCESPFDDSIGGICIDTTLHGAVWAYNGSRVLRNKLGDLSVISDKDFKEQYQASVAKSG